MATARGYDARACQNRQPVLFHRHPGQTLRVEVKEPTDDAKHSGSDHRQGISAPIFRTLPLLRHLRERNE